MQVLTWHAARDLRVERREPPASPPRAGFARVAVRAAGVCGTDLSEYLHGPVMIRPGRPHPLTGQAPPVVLGHEFAGEVVDVGDVCNAGLGTAEPGNSGKKPKKNRP